MLVNDLSNISERVVCKKYKLLRVNTLVEPRTHWIKACLFLFAYKKEEVRCMLGPIQCQV